jgi:predicted PurR-regulated permease PerM
MSEADGGGPSLWRFALLALIAVAIAGAAFLLWHLRDAVMMAFGAVVVAVLLVAFAELLRRFLPLSHSWAVTLAAVLVLLIIAGFAWLMGSQVRSQFASLWEQLPGGIEQIESSLGIDVLSEGQTPGGGQAEGQAEAGQDAGATGAAAPEAQPGAGLTRLWSWIGSYGYPVVNAAFGAILVAITGIFLALQPGTYRRGAVMLFPPAQHARVDETLTYMGRALRFWLTGQLIAMAIVGVLVGVGTWLIGLPAPVALGFFAALVEFVPVIGPIVGAVPAVLLAFSEGASTVLWTVLLYVAIQQIESNMIAPVVQERMVKLPPALFLLAVFAFGGIFGILGVIFAAPLAVVTYVAVQKLWVRDALHERTEVTGERSPARR